MTMLWEHKVSLAKTCEEFILEHEEIILDDSDLSLELASFALFLLKWALNKVPELKKETL